MSYPPTKDKSFPLLGGLDLVNSMQDKHPGSIISGSNIQIVSGKSGYSRFDGIERCTNDVLASTASPVYLLVTSNTATLAVGDVGTSGGISVVCLTAISGTGEQVVPVVCDDQDEDFSAISSITFSGGTIAVDSVVEPVTYFTSAEIGSIRSQAKDSYLTFIPVVTGSGTNDGGFRLRGVNYVFRNGTLYKGGELSWTSVAMPDVMYFEEGVIEIEKGDTITDGTETATVASVTRQTGSWNAALGATEQSAGYLTITGATGSFTVGNNITLDGETDVLAKVETANETYVLPTGGRYETKNYNFTNVADAKSVYGVSGVGPAFEFDGTDYIPIYHPDTTEYPNHLMIHQERLHLCFPGGEKPWSVSGEPRIYNSLLGSGTHSTGSEITGCAMVNGGAAVVICDDARWFLLGYGIYDDESATRSWSFNRHIEEAGGEEWTLTSGEVILFASGGSIYMLNSTDTTAGYVFKDVSEMFAPTLVDKIGEAVCSIWVSSKSQYRIFFGDGQGVCVSFRGNSIIGATPIQLPVDISSVWKSVENDKELLFFLSSDTDYLYRMDSGDSFDGDAITGSFRIPFYGYGSPRNEKEFPQFVLELSAPVLIAEETTIQYTVNFDYGSPLTPLPQVHTAEDVESAGGVYGANAGFGNFVWSGPVVSEIFAYIDGYGANMSVLVSFSTKNDLTFSFQTIHVDYIVHGRKGRG